jgi:drug/metabolite transporter (DMT)-like permease
MDIISGAGGELAALLAAFLWAVASVVYRRVGERIPPVELNLLKGILALAMLGVTLVATRESLAAVEPLALALLALSGVVGIGLGDSAYFRSLECLGARQALLLGILAPPLAGLLAWLALGETLSPGAWVGILITVLGVGWVVTEGSREEAGQSSQRTRGILFGLLAALTQAGGVVLARAAFVHTEVSPLWATFLRLAAGVLALLVWIPLARRPAGRWLKQGRTRGLWARLLFAVFFGTYLAIWLQQVALERTSAGITQTLFSTSPLFVLPIAAWTGERVSIRAVLGAVVALLGVLLLFGLG